MVNYSIISLFYYKATMKNLFFVIIFSFLSNSIFSQTDSLIIFTKKNCSNCTFVKKQFSGNSINYVEFKLEQRENADLMLNKLSEIVKMREIH